MIFVIFALYLLIRLYPYLLSPVPLGYDPGIYLYLWQHDLSIPWLKANPPVIFYLGKFLSLFTSPEHFIIPLSFVVAALLFLSLYLYTKNLWTMFFLTVSAIQYRFWWWYYLKNILAAGFIFFYLYFDQKKSRFKYLFPILLPLLHQPTAIIFFIILILQKQFKSIALFLLTFAAYYLPNYSQTVQPFLNGSGSGTFYSLSQSLLLMLPYLLFSLFALKNKSNRLVSFMFIVTLLIPLLGLFLSRRFIPFFDIFAIILAGITAKRFFSRFPKLKYIYIPVLLIFIGLFVYKTSAAKINVDEFAEIKLLNTTPENSYILVTDNEYTPWVYGYSGRRPITPGFGEYDIYWSDSDWQNFWLSGNRQTELALLKKLPQPLYIWRGDRSYPTKFSLEGDCFRRFSWHTYEFLCATKL